jgi:phosphoribosylpyrophosphate synthetase
MPYPGITSDTCYISERVIGKNIILVDDLYTKTVNIDEDAIQALLDRGAESVTFYSLGKTFNPEYAGEQRDHKVILNQITLNIPIPYQETYHLILEGKNLQQIIQIRGLKEETIIKHISEIVKIKGSSIATNFKPRVEIIDAVRTAVNRVGSIEKLRPIYDELGGEVSWNDIRLSIIFI